MPRDSQSSLQQRELDVLNPKSSILNPKPSTPQARNAERFAELYSSALDVKVPRIYWRFSRRKVLTMEWIDGVRITSKSLSGKPHVHPQSSILNPQS
jgi:hypothetical protein